MSRKKIYPEVDCRKIISRVKEITGLKQKDIAVQVFNISDKNLCNQIGRNSVNLYKLMEWAIDKSVGLNWLITGEGRKRNPAERVQDLDGQAPYGVTSENDLLATANRILKSGTIYEGALAANIRAFSEAMATESALREARKVLPEGIGPADSEAHPTKEELVKEDQIPVSTTLRIRLDYEGHCKQVRIGEEYSPLFAREDLACLSRRDIMDDFLERQIKAGHIPRTYGNIIKDSVKKAQAKGQPTEVPLAFIFLDKDIYRDIWVFPKPKTKESVLYLCARPVDGSEPTPGEVIFTPEKPRGKKAKVHKIRKKRKSA